MRLGLCPQVLYDRPLEHAVDALADLQLSAIELPVDAGSPWIDLEDALTDRGDRIRQALERRGVELSALSNHQEGQSLFGSDDRDPSTTHQGSPEDRVAYALDRIRKSARLAADLGVDVLCGFTGCTAWSRWFPWPLEDGYERLGPPFRERMLPLLDDLHALGVRFAHECHPGQLAYNIETALWSLDLLDHHPAWAFNFDPANLMLAGVDPVLFARELGTHIVHVHAKDGEDVPHHAARSGRLAHGPWHRPGRGFRFRVAGWGDLDWRRLITELHLAGFTGTWAIEHEDPTMSRLEGVRQAAQFLRPLLLQHSPPDDERWW